MVRILALLLACFGAVSFCSLVSFWGYLRATRHNTDHIDLLNRLWTHAEVLHRIADKPSVDSVDLAYVRQAVQVSRRILPILERGGDYESLAVEPMPASLSPAVEELRKRWNELEAAGLIQLAETVDVHSLDGPADKRLHPQLPSFQGQIQKTVAATRQRSRELRTLVLIVLGASTLVSIALFAITIAIVRRRIVTPVQELAQGTAAIQSGHFDHRVPLRYTDEIGFLARSFNEMAAMLGRLFADEKRLRGELTGANELLNESQERLAHAQAVAKLGNWDVDWKTKEYYWSPQVYRIFGRDPESEPVTEASFWSWVEPDDVEAVRAKVQYAIRHHSPYHVEHRILLPDGSLRFVREQAEFLYDAAGVPARLMGTVQDITELKAIEEQLRQSAKMEAVGRLAGGVAHDFNNLLTVINGYALLALRRISQTDPLHHEVEQIQFAGERAATLTKQLLAFGRKQILQPKPIQLNRIVEQLVPLLERLLTESIELVNRADPGLQLILADPTQIEQVIINLVVNAKDAMPSGGKVIIECANVDLDDDYAQAHVEAVSGPHVMLSVTDTGVGMEKSVVDRIFEPFFTTKEQGKGIGLGLATVFGIVKQSGGHIWVYSELNRGSTFKVYFPAMTEASVVTEETRVAPSLKHCMETILLVEDNDQVRDYVSGVLKRFEYQVLPAANALDALAIAESFPSEIHLLLTDVMLPKMSGEELSAKLLASRPRIRILFISGYTQDAIAHQGVLSTDVEFLAKPFTPDAIVEKVRQVLDAPPKRRTILVVDDEPAVRQFLFDLLAADGYEVSQAANGKEAIARCEQQIVDVALIDLVMPEQEGLETIQKMRQRYPQLRIVAMTGAFQGLFLRAATLMGADAILQKPIKHEALSAALGDVLPPGS